jgi:hypothetical protein
VKQTKFPLMPRYYHLNNCYKMSKGNVFNINTDIKVKKESTQQHLKIAEQQLFFIIV